MTISLFLDTIFQSDSKWFHNSRYMGIHSLFNQFPNDRLEVISMFWAILNKGVDK